MSNIKIFTYWHDENLPLFNKYCIESWKKYNPKCEIIILNDNNLNEYINDNNIPKNFNYIIKQHKSDYIRTYMLFQYGGIWIDNTIILKDSLDNIFDFNIKNKLQLFTSNSCTFKSPYSKMYKNDYFENSLMCCLKPNNYLCKAILNNFSWCIENSNINYNIKYTVSNCLYFINLYKKNKIKLYKHFKKNNWTCYLTHMNITALLINSNTFDEHYHRLNKNMNFLLYNINAEYSFNPKDKHLKIVHHTREKLIDSILKNKIPYNLSEWIDTSYFTQ